MKNEAFDRGLEMRKRVLSPEHVERSLSAADDFSRPMQEFVTEFCWGAVWGREGLSPRDRSLINLGMIAALGRNKELALHTKGALRNGVTESEIQELLLQIAAYCGFPAALDSMAACRAGMKEFAEEAV